MARSALHTPQLILGVSLLGVSLLGSSLVGCTADPTAGNASAQVSLTTSPAGSDSVATPSVQLSDSTSAEVTPSAPVQIQPDGAVAHNLEAPWGLGILPDGSALIAERDTGLIKQLPAGPPPDGSAVTKTLGEVAGVAPGGEGGLLGLAVSPDFAVDGTIYVYFTGADANQVDAITVTGGQLTDQRTILADIPSANTHNGGRLLVGPDHNLYIGTGDAGEREDAQDLTSLAGKILRIALDGQPAVGNPFPDAPLIYSLGHRNVQGLAFDDAGRLWAAEFGPSSVDELNLIVPGNNYGWPVVEGRAGTEPYTDPEQVWDTSDASPSGIAVARGSVWMAGLGGETLWEIPILENGTTSEPIPHFEGEYGRLRTVLVAPDDSLWVSTSNTDGRGEPGDDDDRILRFVLS